jgi:hypothetical protein
VLVSGFEAVVRLDIQMDTGASMALTPTGIATLSPLLDEALALPADMREQWLQASRQFDLDPAVARPGDRIGPYRLLRESGQGGLLALAPPSPPSLASAPDSRRRSSSLSARWGPPCRRSDRPALQPLLQPQVAMPSAACPLSPSPHV